MGVERDGGRDSPVPVAPGLYTETSSTLMPPTDAGREPQAWPGPGTTGGKDQWVPRRQKWRRTLGKAVCYLRLQAQTHRRGPF